MEDARMLPSEEITNSRPRKKKISISRASLIPLQGNDVREVQQLQGALRPSKKAYKRNIKIEQQERSNSDSLPDSSTSGNEYRSLRSKYISLEEESFSLGKELKVVEDEVKALEDEKLALLDQLVVLEGLVEPSKVISHGLHSL